MGRPGSRHEPLLRCVRAFSWASTRDDGSSVVPQLATAAAVAFSIALPVIELGRIWLFAPASNLGLAIVATAAYLPLHLRHVIDGLRGTRPAYAGWSLAAMAMINGAAAVLVEAPWGLMLASLAASILLVVRPPWSIGFFAAVVAAPLLWGITQGPDPARGGGAYLAFSVAFRSVTLFVMVWLVAATRQLYAARAALSDSAVVHERVRIEADLGRTVGVALERIIDDGRRVAESIDRPMDAEPVLRRLVDGSRDALTGARRTVGSYQQVTVRSELEAACTLLVSAGIDARLVVTGRPALDATDDYVRSQLRSVMGRLLRDPPAQCTIELESTPDGLHLDVTVASGVEADEARQGTGR